MVNQNTFKVVRYKVHKKSNWQCYSNVISVTTKKYSTVNNVITYLGEESKLNKAQ